MSGECRGCGNVLPDRALSGLCPVCLLRQGLAGISASSGDTAPAMSLTVAPAASALATLDRSLGGLPRVLLRDSELDSAPGPLVQPGSPEMPALGAGAGRLQLLGEIARGGMGAVLKGRDPDLGRDVAIKVLLDSHRGKPELIRRFIEEAQIGGQLQHPGIVPIYELGAFADQRPYFAMKLVKGRTLSNLQDERSDRAHDVARFLAIFEAVCQTIAYAHARGVIHRDLKPSNIMVGSFGEVQVMDWGLAKVLPQGGAADDATAGKTRERETVIATARSGGESDSDLSRAGSVMGTPSYMAPEQARGEVERLDERCDVFALGSILCEILTGEPAFTGRSSGEIQRKASRGELKETLDRLDARGGDSELIALAKDCLSSELEDRPRHAGEVAARINAHQAGVQERLRLAEIARAEEKARAEEATKRARVERDRLRLTVALAATAMGLILLAAGVWGYLAQQHASRRAATERNVSQAVDEANQLRGQARAAGIGDLSKWFEAQRAAEKANALMVAGEADADLKNRVANLVLLIRTEQSDATHRALELARDRQFLDRLESVRLDALHDEDDGDTTDTAYSMAFKEFGIDPDRLDPEETGRLLALRSNASELAYYLDEWAVIRQYFPKGRSGDSWKRLLASARGADPDPWRDKLRKLVEAEDADGLARLAIDEQVLAGQPARSLLILSTHLGDYLGAEVIDRVLRPAWELHPDDFGLCYELGTWGNIRFSTAAVALRPQNAAAHYELGEHLLRCGGEQLEIAHDHPMTAAVELKEAITHYRAATRNRPGTGIYHLRLAHALFVNGNPDEAIAQYREAIRLGKRWMVPQHNLAVDLLRAGRWDDALVEYEGLLRANPSDASIQGNFLELMDFLGKATKAGLALSDEVRSRQRLRAAIAAAQAGTGPDAEEKGLSLDHPVRARWRAYALRWMRAEREFCGKILDPATVDKASSAVATPQKLALARKSLDILTHHRDLACVRDEKELARLPEPERKEWQAFWAEVAALLKKADGH